MKKKWFSTLMILMLLVVAVVPTVIAAPQYEDIGSYGGRNTDDLSHPLGDEQRAAKELAVEAKLNGKTTGKVHQVAKGQYVELAREGEDSIWTVFGGSDPDHPD